MVRHSLPPLLRGVGTTIVLIGTVIALVTAQIHHQSTGNRTQNGTSQPAAAVGAGISLETIAQEVRELKSEVETETIAEEVVENQWFEWLGIIGAAVISSSFYAEAILRRSRE